MSTKPPSTTARFLIGFGGISALLCLLSCCVLGFYVRAFQQDIVQSGEGLRADAESFARTHDQNACVEEALRRTDVCGEELNIMCHAHAGIFLTVCADNATPVAGFCDGVPSTREIMDSVAWSMRTCSDRGRPNEQTCTRLLQGIQRHCHP